MTICLVIDDSTTLRMLTSEIMSSFGLDVEEATNGKEGLEKCKNSLPDLIILDWCMPEMDGIEFLHQLRQTNDKLPYIIMCTGNRTDVEDLEGALESCVAEYILKPVDQDILREKLTAANLV